MIVVRLVVIEVWIGELMRTFEAIAPSPQRSTFVFFDKQDGRHLFVRGGNEPCRWLYFYNSTPARFTASLENWQPGFLEKSCGVFEYCCGGAEPQRKFEIKVWDYSRVCRSCLGVTPVMRLKLRVRWLWSLNPVLKAISARLSSLC